MLGEVLINVIPKNIVMPPFVLRGDRRGGMCRRQSIDPVDIEMRLAAISILHQQEQLKAAALQPLDDEPEWSCDSHGVTSHQAQRAAAAEQVVDMHVPTAPDHHVLQTHVMKHYPLTDQHYFQQTECYLNKTIAKWEFDVLKLDETSAQGALKDVCLKLLETYDLIEQFQLSLVQLHQTFQIIQTSYHNNPYHNAAHAADVVQASCCLISEPRISKHISGLERLAMVVAAACHDLDHPGVNQSFLVQTNHHLTNAASLYPRAPSSSGSGTSPVSSVLEIHHIRHAAAIFEQTRVFDHLDETTYIRLLALLRELILATDMAFQNNYLQKLKRLNKQFAALGTEEEKDAFFADEQIRRFYLQISLKCADICNTCRPWEVTQKWAYRVTEEFFAQGDKERSLQLDVTPIFDRTKTTVEKVQTGFLKFVARPLFEEWAFCHNSDFSNSLIRNIDDNLAHWNERMQPANEDPPGQSSHANTVDKSDVKSQEPIKSIPSQEPMTPEDSPDQPMRTQNAVEPIKLQDSAEPINAAKLSEPIRIENSTGESGTDSPVLSGRRRSSVPCALALSNRETLEQVASLVDNSNIASNASIASNSHIASGEPKHILIPESPCDISDSLASSPDISIRDLSQTEKDLLEKLKYNPFDLQRELDSLTQEQRERINYIYRQQKSAPVGQKSLSFQFRPQRSSPFDSTDPVSNPSLNHYAKLTSPPPYRKGTMASVEKSLESLRRIGKEGMSLDNVSGLGVDRLNIAHRTASARSETLNLDAWLARSPSNPKSQSQEFTPDLARRKINVSRTNFFQSTLVPDTLNETDSDSVTPASQSNSGDVATSPSGDIQPASERRASRPKTQQQQTASSGGDKKKKKSKAARRSHSAAGSASGAAASLRNTLSRWFRPSHARANQTQQPNAPPTSSKRS